MFYSYIERGLSIYTVRRRFTKSQNITEIIFVSYIYIANENNLYNLTYIYIYYIYIYFYIYIYNIYIYIIYIYVGCLGYLLKKMSVLEILQTSV